MGVQPITVPKSLAAVLDSAGDKSGVDFSYLLNTAMRESALNPKAKAPTSSATGLFQFLDSTWLRLMKEEGPRLGYQKYADAIQQTRDGGYYIADKGLRAQILKLREDPQVSSDLAAAYTKENGAYLEGKFGKMPSPGELYIAHFLGAQGAETLFRAGLNNPDQNAAKLFPRQAAANPTIFYHDGKARSIKELYRVLVANQQGSAAAAAAADVAASTEVQPAVAADPVPAAAFAAANLAADVPATAQAQAPGPTSDATTGPNFAAQQYASSRWPTQEIPSRFAGGNVSFTGLFSNEVAIPGRVLMSPKSESQGPALFTQLFGQGQAQPLTPLVAAPLQPTTELFSTDVGEDPQPLVAPLVMPTTDLFSTNVDDVPQPLEPLPMPPPPEVNGS